MAKDSEKVGKRLENIRKFYDKAGQLIDGLDGAIPEDVRERIKKIVLEDKELKKLMDGIEANRPPRIFLVGRTGVGKSSLVNALCGSYVAQVSDTMSCTSNAEICQCMDGNRVLMEILDTRGIAESSSLDDTVTAEDALIHAVNEFSPDVAIFMLNCTHRDDVNTDVEFLKKVSKVYASTNKQRLPIVVVVNKCDEMAPARYKDPDAYPANKIAKIDAVVQNYKSIIVENGLKIDDIIAVSSLIEWKMQDGMEIDVESIENLPQADINDLQIAFDGRYHIEELLDILGEAIHDFGAQAGLRMAARLDDVMCRFAKQLTRTFSMMAAGIAFSALPIADVYLLLMLQAILVSLIASLSGKDVSLETAKEFILSMGGVVGAGFTFRLIAQQGAKLANLLYPAAGSVLSAGIASAGTTLIGKTAIAYYIEGKNMDEAKKMYDEVNKEKIADSEKD